jgi:hypothetical protein
MDADDRLLPNAFEAGLNCLDDHPECAFTSGQVKLIAADDRVVPEPEQYCSTRDHYLTLLRYNYIWTPSAVMFKRCIFESGFAYKSSLSGGADWDLYLRISRNFPVCCHDNVIAEYRVHGGSMSHNSALMLRDSLAVLCAQWDYVRGNKQYDEALRLGIKGVQEYYGQPLVDDIRRQLRAHEWKHAIRCMLMLLRYHPRGFVKNFYPTL